MQIGGTMTHLSEQELNRLVEIEAERKVLLEKLTAAVKERFDADKRRFTGKGRGLFMRITEVKADRIEFCYSEDYDPEDVGPEYSSMSSWELEEHDEEGDEG